MRSGTRILVSLGLGFSVGCGESERSSNHGGVPRDAGNDAPTGEPAENTVPFEGGVYVASGSGAEAGLRRFWPSEAARYYAGYAEFADFFVFRPSDSQLFYLQGQRGFFIDDAVDAMDTEVLTPPCVKPSGEPFTLGVVFTPIGFDAQGLVHYDCDAEIRRGDSGELVHPGPRALSGVLADGRMVLLAGDGVDPFSERFVAVDRGGQTLATLDLPLHVPFHKATSVQGNDAFVVLQRFESTAPDPNISYAADFVMYRLDAASRWLHVRDLHVDYIGLEQLLISDGTLFIFAIPDDGDRNGMIFAYPPGGGVQTVWSASGAGLTSFSFGPRLVFGPREPSGASLR